MLAKDKFLLRRGKPKPDESFMGYILRLTERNRYESLAWIFEVIDPQYSKRNQSYKSIFEPARYLNSLARLIYIPEDELRQLIYPCETSLDVASPCYFFGQAVSEYAIRYTNLIVCPDCLSESPYCRRVWELLTTTVCPTHKRLLIDTCPNCKKRISWFRKAVCVCPCDFDWRRCPPASVGELELGLARHIYRICKLDSDNNSIAKSAEKSPLYNLSLQETISALFFIAGRYGMFSTITDIPLFPSYKKNYELHALLTNAFSVFEDWPNNYYLFLDRIREKQKRIPANRHRQKSVLYVEFGNFYGNLFKMLSGSSFEFIRRSFVEYLISRWDGHHALLGSFKRSETLHGKSKHISLSDAVRLLEASPEEIGWLIRMSKIRVINRSKGKRRLVFTDLMDVVNSMRSLGQ